MSITWHWHFEMGKIVESLNLTGRFEFIGKGCKRHYKRKRPIVQWNCTIRCIPLGRAIILCIDDKQHAARFGCDEQATPGGRCEKLPA